MESLSSSSHFVCLKRDAMWPTSLNPSACQSITNSEHPNVTLNPEDKLWPLPVEKNAETVKYDVMNCKGDKESLDVRLFKEASGLD